MTDASTLRSDARVENAKRPAPSGDSRLERARSAFGDAVILTEPFPGARRCGSSRATGI
jgi:hypothetical protein